MPPTLTPPRQPVAASYVPLRLVLQTAITSVLTNSLSLPP